MRFLITAIGSIGDVFPCLAIASRLRDRGHEVYVLTNPYFGPQVAKLGLACVPVGTLADQERTLSHPWVWSRLRGWSLWLRLLGIPAMRPMFEAVRQLYVPGETVVLGSWGGFGARIAQEVLGIPLASVYLEPDKFRTAEESTPMPLPFLCRDWHSPAARRWQFWLLDRGFLDHFLFKVNRFRRELGLPPARRLLHDWWHAPQLTIGLFPDWWAPIQPDWPPQTVLTGFPLWDQPKPPHLSREIEQFLEAGEPPVVFTPGAMNRQSKRFFTAAAEACAMLGCRAIFLAESPALLPPDLPAGVRVFAYAPFSSLFPRTGALVHRAGIGTAAQALAAALPQVVVPTMHIHHDTARRLRHLGVARVVPPKQLDSRALADAIAEVASSSEVRRCCRQVAARMPVDQPIDNTCDLLEGLVGTDRPANRAATASSRPASIAPTGRAAR